MPHKAVYRGVINKNDVELTLEVPFKEHTYALPAFQVVVDLGNPDTKTNSIIFRYSHSLVDHSVYEKNVDREGEEVADYDMETARLVPRWNGQ